MTQVDLTTPVETPLEALDAEIEALELHDMSETEIEAVIAAMSPEGMAMRASRKEVRYHLYRCRTDAEGKASADVGADFRAKFESQTYFDGWRFFGVTWDVAFDDPYRIVHKDKSEQAEWDELVAAKFPTIIDGKVVYPDINIRRKVEAEAASRGVTLDGTEENC